MADIAIENGHRNSGFTHEKMVIFNSYVKLPEGILCIILLLYVHYHIYIECTGLSLKPLYHIVFVWDRLGTPHFA